MDIKPIQLFCNLLYQKSNHETLSSRNNDGTEMCHGVQNQALSAKQLVKRRELHCLKDWEFNLTNLIHNKKLVQKKMNEQVGTGNFLVGNPTRSLQTQPRTKRRRSIRRNFDRQLNCLITQSAFQNLRWIACQWRAKYISVAVNLEHALHWYQSRGLQILHHLNLSIRTLQSLNLWYKKSKKQSLNCKIHLSQRLFIASSTRILTFVERI